MNDTFFLIKRQKGEGCDYTIGCGVQCDRLVATDFASAVKEAIGISDNWKQEALESDSPEDYINDNVLCRLNWFSGERELEEAIIVKVNLELDLLPIIKAKAAEAKEFMENLDSIELENVERAEYERLKKKFENL